MVDRRTHPGGAQRPFRQVELPYAFGALEPLMSETTVRLHYTVHHKGYVDGANRAQDGLLRLDGPWGRQFDLPTRAAMRHSLTEDLAFQAAGALLHNAWWENLAPIGQTGRPTRDLATGLEPLGGPDGLLHSVFELGTTLKGSGWVVLAWCTDPGILALWSIQDHEHRLTQDSQVLLAIDVWEHAYYLDQPANREGYLRSIRRLVNWNTVNRRYADRTRSNRGRSRWTR